MRTLREHGNKNVELIMNNLEKKIVISDRLALQSQIRALDTAV
jgi:hypothetical protein